MSLSGADETREFASRITYEAREDLAKENRSQLPRAISMEDDNDDGDDDDDDDDARTYVHEKESAAGT